MARPDRRALVALIILAAAPVLRRSAPGGGAAEGFSPAVVGRSPNRRVGSLARPDARRSLASTTTTTTMTAAAAARDATAVAAAEKPSAAGEKLRRRKQQQGRGQGQGQNPSRRQKRRADANTKANSGKKRDGSSTAAPNRKKSNKSPSRQRHRQQQGKGQRGRRRTRNTRAMSIARGRDPLVSLNMNLDAMAKSAEAASASSSSSSSRSRAATLEAARRAEELLVRIEALHREGYYDAPPDAVSYNSVMNAYAVAGGIEGAEEAERVFRRMMEASSEEERPGGKGGSRPNVVSFNTVILAFANSGQAERAEALLDEMEDLCSVDACASDSSSPNGDIGSSSMSADDCRPNTITYNEVIHAWAKARNPQRAEALLRRMMEVSHGASAAKERGIAHDDERDVKPDTIAFNAVLHAWASSGGGRDAALRCEDLLRHMEKLRDSGNDDVRPDVVSYTSVISAWSASGDGEAASRKCAEWLEYMDRRYEETGDEGVRPNAVSYTCAINALGRSDAPGSAARAHDLLERMESLSESGDRPDLRPDAVCYSSVIDAYARSARRPPSWEGEGGEMAAHSAEMLLERMNELYRTRGGDVSVRPNVRTYCSVLSALGRSGAYGAAERAEALLDDMERMYAFGENEGARPNAVAYNAVIDAYARSGLVDKAERAKELLDRMRERAEGDGVAGGDEDVAPDVITYNSVLHAAASSYAKQDPLLKRRAFRIALDAFKAAGGGGDGGRRSSSADGAAATPRRGGGARRPVRRTAVTYSLFLKAVRRLVPEGPERDAMVRKTFQYCVLDGLVNGRVLDQLRIACRSSSSTPASGERRDAEAGKGDENGDKGSKAMEASLFTEVLRSCGHRPDAYADADKVVLGVGDAVGWKDLPEEWRRNAGRRR